MSKQERYQVHRRETLFQHRLTSNEGELEAWDETNSPVWTSGKYVELVSLDAIESFMQFRYGVLTFDVYADDWTDIIMGFGDYAQGENYVVFTADSFISEKNDLGPATTAIALTDGTWYHVQMIWCPQFVSIEIWEHDNTMAGYAKHRNPPNIEMPLYFEGLTSDPVYVANVVVQEGDSAEFFLTKRDHVIMDHFVTGGAAWSTYDYGQAASLSAAGHASRAMGSLIENYSRFRVRIFYQVDATVTPSFGLRSRDCAGTLTTHVAFATAITLTQFFGCYVTAWYSGNGLPRSVSGLLAGINATPIYIRAWQLEFE